MNLISICVTCISLLTCQLDIFAETPILEFVKQGCRANDHLVHSGMGHLTCKVKFLELSEDHKDYEAEIFFVFKGKKLRYDSECSSPKTRLFSKRREILKQVFDGEKTTTFSCKYYPDEGTIFPGGSIEGRNGINMDNVPISYGIAFYSKSLEELLSEEEAEVIGSEMVDGELCYRIKTTFEAMVPLEILINTKRGFRAQEIKTFSAQGTVGHSISLVEFEKGVWFPINIKIQFPFSEPFSGELKEIIVKDDFKINVDIPDDLFTIKFPSGIPVYDSRIKKSFRAE